MLFFTGAIFAVVSRAQENDNDLDVGFLDIVIRMTSVSLTL